MRSSGLRISKYDAKMVGDVVKNRIDAQRTSMVAQVTTQFPLVEAAELAAKSRLNDWGVTTTLIPSYLNFARQCKSISLRHSSVVALNEICLRFDSWVSRGLSPFYLAEICNDVCGIDISSCTV